MASRGEDLRFSGMIGGFGTERGQRVVVGAWRSSPFGSFTDVMIEDEGGHRTLIAPSQAIADFIASTYSFDEVIVEPVALERSHAWLSVSSASIRIRARIGGTTALGRLLRLVPRRLAVDPAWPTLLDPIARTLSPGSRTAGSAGSGRREYYGVLSARGIHEISGDFRGDEFGRMSRLHPPVHFGFGSPPARPSLVAVTTTIRMPPDVVRQTRERRERRRRRLPSEVDVHRVYDGATYVRVNSIGTTGDRPFVLVPGIGVSSTYFEKLAPHLNEFGPVHALDLPGFGGVPHPDDALSIRQYADLVGRVIDQLQLKDPIVVGHSMGSQVVSDLVARRPELSTVVLIGPVIHPTERRIPTQALRFLQASWHEPLTVKMLAIGAYVFCGVKWFSRILPKMIAYPIEDQLPHIRAHTLVIRGEFDAVAPRDWVRTCAELLPSSRLWEIPGAAHSVMYAHAEEVARLCVEHARRTAADGDDDRLHVFDEQPEEHHRPPRDVTPDLANIGAALKGRVVETVGVIQGDDEKIEDGKSITAEAIRLSGDGSADEARRPDTE